MSYYYSVIKDKPVGFWKLDEVSGLTAYDFSGCGNNGSYIGSINKSAFPLVSGGVNSNIINNSNYVEFSITKDFSGQSGKGGFGIINTGDNDFSLEIWFHPKNLTTDCPIFADTNDIGIYWDNGNIVFKLENERLDYTLYNPNKYFHIVTVYTGSTMKIYVDGKLVAVKNTGKINFTNESLTLTCGPSDANKSFIIDAPDVYRYSLNDNQVLNHYIDAQTNSEAQIVISDSGKIFKTTEKHQSETEKFIYPITKSWQYFTNDDLSYNDVDNYIYLNTSSSNGNFIQVISLLHWKEYVSSKIEWEATSGVSVFVSSDNSTWNVCTNGGTLTDIDFENNKTIFIKVEFSSSDTSKYNPKMKYLGVYLYDQKNLYCHNGSEIINSLNGDIDISNKEYSILSRYSDNGIKTNTSAFYFNTESDIYNLELILTPDSIGQGCLFYNKTGLVESYISWNNGVVTKSNINKLYINGQDLTSVNDISTYLLSEEPNYILIKTNSAMSGNISFNGKYLNGSVSDILPDNLYKNIAIYQDQDINHLLHYNLYIGNDILEASGSVMSVTEEAVKTYSKNWVVVNNA